ncbi:MAG: hypothetical protein HY370_09710 [Proteobacteria bacterium]|nr:hypothetical protein [Pseudomonadota bacterium]
MRKSTLFLSIPGAFIFSFFDAGDARAEDAYPAMEGSISIELQNDWAYDSDDRSSEVNTMFTTIEPAFVLSLTEHLAIEAALVFEPIQNADPGDDTFFDNEGGYIEELKLTWAEENFSLFAGKYNPPFGMAWDMAPGIWGGDFAEDYETTERIGFGGHVNFGSESAGEHTITAGTYFADTTLLSESVVTRRGELDKSDGGISNTEDFSSFAVALDSANPAGLEGLRTHGAYRHQAAGDADIGADDEDSFALGANYEFPVSQRIQGVALGEGVVVHNVDGGTDDVNYLTTSFTLIIDEAWNIAASWTGREMDISGGADIDDDLFQFSAGYAFENGLRIDAGYRYAEDNGIETRMVGTRLSYGFNF